MEGGRRSFLSLAGGCSSKFHPKLRTEASSGSAVCCTLEWRGVNGAARASNLLKVLISERGGSEKRRKRRRRKGKEEEEEKEAARVAAIKLA